MIECNGYVLIFHYERIVSMKSYVRILAILLIFIMSVSVFVGCGETEPEVTTAAPDATDATEDEYLPEIEKNNYGEEFYLNILPDVNPMDFYWVEEAGDAVLSNALYNRQENVRKYLGVEIVGVKTDGENRYVEPFKNAVKIKDGSVDTLVSHVYYGIDGFITGNYLTDFQDIPELDLYADYWKYDVMDEISANGHFYLGFSDFNIFYTHVITFNKELLARYEDQLDESLYETVENYRWTLDKMISVAELVYIDAESNGKTDDDTFGFVTSTDYIGYAGMIQGLGIQLIEQDDRGNYVMAIFTEKNKQKTDEAIKKLYNLVRSDFAYMPIDKQPAPSMGNGRALMAINGTYWLSNILSTGVDFGVLPYPMYNEAQKEYRSLQWGGYICVPAYMGEGDRPQMIGETLEMLSYYSDEVNTAFYEKMLGKQVADMPEDKKMLDIVWDSVCSELALTYYSVIKDSNEYLYCLSKLTEEGTNANLSSYVAGCQTSINNKLKKFFKSVK